MHGAEYPISTIVTVLDSLCIDNFSLFTVFSSVLSDGQHAVRPIGIIVYLHYLYIRPLNMSSAKISNLDNKERRLSSVYKFAVLGWSRKLHLQKPVAVSKELHIPTVNILMRWWCDVVNYWKKSNFFSSIHKIPIRKKRLILEV